MLILRRISCPCLCIGNCQKRYQVTQDSDTLLVEYWYYLHSSVLGHHKHCIYVKIMANSGFEDWLCKKLTSLDIDNEVYGSYITGILEDSEESDRKEALGEILESILVGKCYTNYLV